MLASQRPAAFSKSDSIVAFPSCELKRLLCTSFRLANFWQGHWLESLTSNAVFSTRYSLHLNLKLEFDVPLAHASSTTPALHLESSDHFELQK